ncbi:MAG: hypothetical protein HYV36_04375 [Lentisphaerae bacterium]|nr:hypothetical protein [Lentisphaerota bacterium]
MKNKMPRASACGGMFPPDADPQRRRPRMARITLIVDGRPAAVNGLTIREIRVISG